MPTLEEIKAKQQATWSSGDYGQIAWMTSPLGDVLVEAADLAPGSEVLDVATGTGNLALAAARRYCKTTGLDFVPALLEVGRRRAEAEGLDVDFVEGDAENLPFPEASFDYVFSAIGAMFAPNQQKVADELARVCRPGGTVAMLNWTPNGFFGERSRLMARYVPPPAELKPPMSWGDEDSVRELFAGKLDPLTFKRGAMLQRYRSPEHYVEVSTTCYGPTLKTEEALDEEKRAAYRADLIELVGRFNRATNGTAAIEAEYTIVLGVKG